MGRWIEIHGSELDGYYLALSDDSGRRLFTSDVMATWQAALDLAKYVREDLLRVVIVDKSGHGLS